MSISHRQRFLGLTQYVNQYSSIWRESPFYGMPLDWQTQYPQLSAALLSLSDQHLEDLDINPTKLHQFIARHLCGYQNLLPYLDIEFKDNLVETSRFVSQGVPGRKWQQIRAFLGASDTNYSNDYEIVDWCSGKSHLGRTYAHIHGARLVAIERDQTLCEQGGELASKFDVKAEFQCMDVLQEHMQFNSGQKVLALHACGDLHRTLVQQWARSKSDELVLAPCCYDKWLKSDFTPLSMLAKENNLNLTRTQVRLAVQEAVTAPHRDQVKMHQLKVLRLAFDALQREVTGVDRYMPTPSLPLSVVNLPAKVIFSNLAQRKGIELPKEYDADALVNDAQAKYQNIRRLQLAGHGFRRALELWLICDLALFLEESGKSVSMHQFCRRDLSPRNIQIIAC